MKAIYFTNFFLFIFFFTNGEPEEKCWVTHFAYSKAETGIWQFWASGLVTVKIPFICMGNKLLG